MSNYNKLKPCPFCGRPAGEDSHGMASCTHCAAFTGDAEAWNRRASPWISVEERLPEHAVRVLAYGKDAAKLPFIAYLIGRVGWIDDFDDEEVIGVTHWMLLPELPDE